jgi:hypothetical protein
VRDADITVLAADRGTLRPGARLFPLDRWMARHPGVFGDEVVVTARLRDHLPGTPSVVVVVASGAAPESFVDEPLPGLPGMLGATGPLTVSVTCPMRTEHAVASVLSMYNQHPDALPEALVEAVAAARRCGLLTLTGNVVLLLQRFVPAAASAVVHASPSRGTPVRIDGRWGITERLSEADTFEVDGTTVSETLAWKPTASLAATGGTSTVPVPDGWRRSIGQETVRELAAMARGAAVAANTRLTLDIVLGDGGPVVLRCRPSKPAVGSRPGRDNVPGCY